MYRLFFNLAQCFSFLGVVFALIKEFLDKQVLLLITCTCASLIVVFVILMIFTYKKDKDDK